MTPIFTNAKGQRLSQPFGDTTLDQMPAGVGVLGASGKVTLHLYRDGWAGITKTMSSAPYFIVNQWKPNKYTLDVTAGKTKQTFKWTVKATPPTPAPVPPTPTPPTPPTPEPQPIPQPVGKAQNTICTGDTALKVGAVVVEEGFPFFLHTLGLLPASMSWVPNLPLHNFDFDWSMEGMARFASARGRAYAGILPAGVHEGSLLITHPKSGGHGKLNLTVTSIATPRKTVTVKNESELRAASATAGTDVHFGASFEIAKAITLASMIRWYGEGYTLTSRIGNSAPTVIQPRGADGFAGQGFTVDGDADVFFSPNGTRFALLDVIVNRVGHLVNANGKPAGLLMQDCRTRDENSIRKYMGWLDGKYHVIRGCWVDDSRDEHCFRGGLTVSAYDRCWLNNAERSNSMSKGTITAHTVKDLSIDLCNCGRTGRGDRIGGGEIAFGPLNPSATTPTDQLTAERISVTRTFMRDGAKVCLKAGTIGARVQDCATNFTKYPCFTLCDSQNQPILKPVSDYSFVNCGPGEDPTPKWVDKVVAA